jgi:hypothetical protein
LIAALVEKGVPSKLRPGRSYIARIPEFPEDTRKIAIPLFSSIIGRNVGHSRTEIPHRNEPLTDARQSAML